MLVIFFLEKERKQKVSKVQDNGSFVGQFNEVYVIFDNMNFLFMKVYGVLKKYNG